MTNPKPFCPQCNLADKTYKVSLLYLQGSARLNRRERDGQPELDMLLNDMMPESSSQADEVPLLTGLVRIFSPPAGEKRITRQIHPDAMVAFFSLLGILLLNRMALDQPAALVYAAIIFAVVLVFYLITRKKVIGRYHSRLSEELEANSRVEREVAHWMQLYYCSRDQGVFYPDHNEIAPVDQIRSFLRAA